jgi:1,4-alpha-glucan branching enzyme
MAGDEWQKFANLRLLFGYMYTQPGKKLLFMGSEFGQVAEWKHDSSLEWHVLRYATHEGLQRWVRDLNAYYRNEPALYQCDFSPEGWRWIDADDSDHSVLTYLRLPKDQSKPVLIACNFTPVPRRGYRVGVPHEGHWHEVLNSNAAVYGGTDEGNFGGKMTEAISCHGHDNSLLLNLPPLAMVVLKQ